MTSSRSLRSLFLGLLVLGSYKLLSLTFAGPSGQIRINSRNGLSVARRADEEEKTAPADDLFEVGQEVECVIAGYAPATGKMRKKGSKWDKNGRLDLAGVGNPRGELMTGMKVKGKVKAILGSSVWVDIDGKAIDGNLHVKEISPDRDARIENMLSVGDYVDARVLNFKNDKQCWRLTTESNPKGKLEVGSKVKAKFLEFEPKEFAARVEIDLDGMKVPGRVYAYHLAQAKELADLRKLFVDSGIETELCFLAWGSEGVAELASCDHPLVTTLKAGTKVKGNIEHLRRYSARVAIEGQHAMSYKPAEVWWSHYY